LLLIFPSWLQHSVQPNKGKDFRVTISFNIGYKASGAHQAGAKQPAGANASGPLDIVGG